jgi:hypothetical protein
MNILDTSQSIPSLPNPEDKPMKEVTGCNTDPYSPSSYQTTYYYSPYYYPAYPQYKPTPPTPWPHCGYCPHCGRSGQLYTSSVPQYPFFNW